MGSILILAQMKWDNLNELNLGIFLIFAGNNLIGDKGCKVLSTIYIPQLQILELCKIDEIKRQIGFQI